MIKATVTSGEFVQGNEYDVEPGIGMAMIIAGTADPVTVAKSKIREKAVKKPYETR